MRLWVPVLAVAVVAALAWAAVLAWQGGRADRSLAARMQGIVAAPAAGAPCRLPGAPAPLVLLALGQSNAGNHGAEDEPPAAGDGPRIMVFTGRGCLRLPDPLPGGTGLHRSIWAQLPAQLRSLGVEREVVVALLAVDATSIDDWTRAGSPLPRRLRTLLDDLRAADLQPARVLWQQGESDARAGTTEADYRRGFEALRATLRGAGVTAPVLLAQSTLCRSGDASGVRAAVASLVAQHDDLLPGPDTDRLQGPYRPSGCHFSRSGVEAAAALWARALVDSRL